MLLTNNLGSSYFSLRIYHSQILFSIKFEGDLSIVVVFLLVVVVFLFCFFCSKESSSLVRTIFQAGEDVFHLSSLKTLNSWRTP